MTPKKHLQKIKDQLNELLSKGGNDEKLVDKKRELENLIRNTKP